MWCGRNNHKTTGMDSSTCSLGKSAWRPWRLTHATTTEKDKEKDIGSLPLLGTIASVSPLADEPFTPSAALGLGPGLDPVRSVSALPQEAVARGGARIAAYRHDEHGNATVEEEEDGAPVSRVPEEAWARPVSGRAPHGDAETETEKADRMGRDSTVGRQPTVRPRSRSAQAGRMRARQWNPTVARRHRPRHPQHVAAASRVRVPPTTPSVEDVSFAVDPLSLPSLRSTPMGRPASLAMASLGTPHCAAPAPTPLSTWSDRRAALLHIRRRSVSMPISVPIPVPTHAPGPVLVADVAHALKSDPDESVSASASASALASARSGGPVYVMASKMNPRLVHGMCRSRDEMTRILAGFPEGPLVSVVRYPSVLAAAGAHHMTVDLDLRLHAQEEGAGPPGGTGAMLAATADGVVREEKEKDTARSRSPLHIGCMSARGRDVEDVSMEVVRQWLRALSRVGFEGALHIRVHGEPGALRKMLPDRLRRAIGDAVTRHIPRGSVALSVSVT
jgi:hypothetical protein